MTRDDQHNSKSLYIHDIEFRRDTRHIGQYLERSRFWRNVVLLLVVLAPVASFTFYFSAVKIRDELALHSQMLNIVRVIGAEFDASKHDTVITAGTTGPDYHQLLASLAAIRDQFPPIERLSTQVLRDNAVFDVLDTDDAAVTASAVPAALLRPHMSVADESLRFQSLMQQGQWVSGSRETPMACVRLAGTVTTSVAVLCGSFVADALRAGEGLLTPDSQIAIMFTLLASAMLIYSVMKNHQQVTKSLQLVEKQRDLFLEYSHTDPLTGALNRRVFKSAYRVAEAQLRRNNLPFALITIDIDHFKLINDTHGHDKGDEVLRALVQELQKIIRPSDILMRMGGEEFSILCNLADEKQALSMAEKLREAVSHIKIKTSAGHLLTFTISLGVHIIGNSDSMETAQKRADIALYHAKEAGRNSTVIYSQGLES